MNNRYIVMLPVYNELNSIEPVVKAIKSLGVEVFISDGGSTDGSIDKARAMGVEVYLRKGRGKGIGLLEGLQIAKAKGYDKLVYIDCDDSYPAEQIPNLLQHEDYEQVMGVRDIWTFDLPRKTVNVFFRTLINTLFGTDYRDVQTGMRVLKVDAFAPYLDATGFEIELQLCTVAARKKLRTKEVPITLKKRIGNSKIGAATVFTGIWIVGKEFLLKIFKDS